MDKSSETSKKPLTAKSRLSPKRTPTKVVKISAEKVDALKLDTTATQEINKESPLLPGAIDPRLASFLEPGSPALESFKMLRAKILTRDLKARPRAIMVTSSQPMDGKSTVSVNLAISIAQGINEHVLLVDCDLRRPSIHRILGLNAHVGIREYIEKGTSVGPYLVKTPLSKLTVLPAGKPPANPSELLSSEKMRQLVEELRGRYEDRYIIFDATPAQFAAETTFLASMMDGVLLVVRLGKTSRDSVLEAVENINRDKCIGVVFNASNERQKDYYRHYYRYYQKKQS